MAFSASEPCPAHGYRGRGAAAGLRHPCRRTQLGASVAGQGPDPVWAAARQRGTLRVAVDFGYYPFSGVQQGQPIGYDIDLARAVGQKLGLAVEFVPSNLNSIYDDLANHKADMAASALPYAPEQGWRAGFSTFYFNAGQVLVVPQDSPIAGPQQLGGRTIGAPLGSDADTFARKLAAGDHTIAPAIRLRHAGGGAGRPAARRARCRDRRQRLGAERPGPPAGPEGA